MLSRRWIFRLAYASRLSRISPPAPHSRPLFLTSSKIFAVTGRSKQFLRNLVGSKAYKISSPTCKTQGNPHPEACARVLRVGIFRPLYAKRSPLAGASIYTSLSGLIFTPGPIVGDTVTLLRYVPFNALGFALFIASISVWKLSLNCSSVKEAFPIGT